MKFAREGNTVKLEMTKEDFGRLQLMLGYASGAIHPHDATMFWSWIDFVNRLNAGNPEFTPCEIPAEYQRR